MLPFKAAFKTKHQPIPIFQSHTDSLQWTTLDLWSPKKISLQDQGPGLTTQSFCVAEVLFQWKPEVYSSEKFYSSENLLAQTSEGGGECPLTSLIKP